jgi:hypothetical protein
LKDCTGQEANHKLGLACSDAWCKNFKTVFALQHP